MLEFLSWIQVIIDFVSLLVGLLIGSVRTLIHIIFRVFIDLVDFVQPYTWVSRFVIMSLGYGLIGAVYIYSLLNLLVQNYHSPAFLVILF